MNERVDAMAMRMGEVNAHVIRLDALGKRLTEMADIDSHEFDFDSAPASGGPESEGAGVTAQIPDISMKLSDLEQKGGPARLAAERPRECDSSTAI